MARALTISDGGHLFSVTLREDVELPTLPTKEAPPHMRFIDWWREQCYKMGITYEYRVAEPQGIRIIQSMLKRRSLGDLQELATHFLLDHGNKLKEDPRHFVVFASMADTMEQELKRE